MGITKSDFFTEEQNKIALWMKALGHPARIAIIQFLLEKKSCICGDIVDELPLAQATVSQHLRELKNAEIIKGNIEGNSICYCLNIETIEHIQFFINELQVNLTNNQPKKCC